MEEEVKKWLKKRLEETFKKEKTALPSKPSEEVLPIRKFPVIEKPLEVKKPGINKKIYIGIAAILGVVIVIISFEIVQLSPENHEYKIFITNNGNYSNFTYGIELYNSTSYCTHEFIENSGIQTPSFTFNSTSTFNGKSLKDYEKENYSFDVYVYAISLPSEINSSLFMGITSKDVYDSNLNYQELPKLSKDFSINFDIPIVVNSSLSATLQGNMINLHAEVLGNWDKNASFVCRLSRVYNDTTDSNLKYCDIQESILLTRNQQCVRRYSPECHVSNYVIYIADANIQGRNIGCSFPSNDLTHGQRYKAVLYSYEKLNSTLYSYYEYNYMSPLTLST